MAFPTIPTGGRVVTGVQADSSGTRTFPDLNTLTKNSGDLLLAIIACGSSDAESGPKLSGWGASFTEIGDDSPASNGVCIGVAYKISDGTETGTFTVTQAATISGHAAFVLLSIPGAHPTAAPEVGAIAGGSNSAADPTALSPSWGADDTLWVATAGIKEFATGGSFTGLASAPTNYSNYVDTGISGDVLGGAEGAVAFRQLNASSEDVGGFTLDTSNARNAAMVVAVRPAPPVAAPRYEFVNFQDPGVL